MWPWRKQSAQAGSDIPEQAARKLLASDLPVPIYLNQRIVIDLLATLEDGFSGFTNVETSVSGTATAEAQGRVGLGVSNPFALLGVSLEGSTNSARAAHRSETTERIHTPVSLFARLRELLKARGLLVVVTESSRVEDIVPGSFVEFRASLRVNPIVEALDGALEVISFAEAFEAAGIAPSHTGVPPARRKKKRSQTVEQQVGNGSQSAGVPGVSQLRFLHDALAGGDAIDLVGTLLDHDSLRSVLPVDKNYFAGLSLNELIEGEYRVVGKVTRTLVEENASVNLLRKTGLSRFQQSITDQLQEAFNNVDRSMIRMPSVELEVRGPVFQVVPMAIYA